jgi:hypothetical protein
LQEEGDEEMGRLGDKKKNILKKTILSIFGLIIFASGITHAAPKDIEIKGKQLFSQKPPFTFTLPSELSMIHSFSHENPEENSLTRVYFLIKRKEKQVEEMLIVQIADKTNPRAEPMTVPPLKPYNEKRLYSKGEVKQGRLKGNYLIQSIRWDPNASSLQPIIQKGIVIPSRLALQGQFLFIYRGDHAVLVRYSKDIHSFGLKVSDEGKRWEKESISGNEESACENFQKAFMEMIHSIDIKNY